MYLLFLDESGTPPHSAQGGPNYFVMAGVIVPEDKWSSLRDALLGMKIRRRLRGELKWRYFAPSNTDERNPLRNLDAATRDAIRLEIYQILKGAATVKTLAAVCSIVAAFQMPSITDQQSIYNLTFKVLTERFQYFLQDEGKRSGKKEHGMIVCDHRGHDDDRRLRMHHQMLVHSVAAFTSSYPNLVESVLLQPSNLSIGIQFADLVAGAVWRRFERGDQRWFQEAEPTFRRSSGGNIDGYGLIRVPKVGWV